MATSKKKVEDEGMEKNGLRIEGYTLATLRALQGDQALTESVVEKIGVELQVIQQMNQTLQWKLQAKNLEKDKEEQELRDIKIKFHKHLKSAAEELGLDNFEEHDIDWETGHVTHAPKPKKKTEGD